MIRKLVVLTAVMLVALTGTATALSWNYNDAGTYGPPLSTKLIATEPVDAAKVGKTCDVIVDIGNNESVRLGSNITLETGDDSFTFPNTESKPGDPGPAHLPMKMGQQITVSLTFGPNKEFDGSTYDNAAYSGSGVVTVGECEVPVTPPTTPPTTPPIEVCTCPPPATPVKAPPRTTG